MDSKVDPVELGETLGELFSYEEKKGALTPTGSLAFQMCTDILESREDIGEFLTAFRAQMSDAVWQRFKLYATLYDPTLSGKLEELS